MGLSSCGGGEQPGASGGAGGSSGANGGAPAIELGYCDVQPFVQTKCVRCHSEPPENGAPFSLATYADWAATPPNQDAPAAERAATMVEMGWMPPTGLDVEPEVEDLSGIERQLLLEWIEEGAPRGSGDCD